MSCRELGASIDIHGGGWDLQFPHHENEIAQSEGASGKPFAAYWMHGAFLNFEAEKMSKSVGNFFTTRDVLDKLDALQGPEQLRYFFMRGHYRSEVNFTWETLQDAGNALRGLYTALREVPPAAIDAIDWNEPHAARFRDAMNDDFDTPIAFAVLHELRAEVNRGKSPQLSALLKALAGTLGLLTTDPAKFLQGGMTVDVDGLLAERREAKKARNFPRADEIRKQVESMGIAIEDKPDGSTTWRKK
jgi:cysteinyl-tRNA synthetase